MKKLLIISGVLAVLFVIFFSQIRLGVLTALFMWDMLDGSTLHAPERGKLGWLTPTPVATAAPVTACCTTRCTTGAHTFTIINND